MIKSTWLIRSLGRASAALAYDETGGTAVEYSLVASAIAVSIIWTVVHIGEQVAGLFAAVAAAFG